MDLLKSLKTQYQERSLHLAMKKTKTGTGNSDLFLHLMKSAEQILAVSIWQLYQKSTPSLTSKKARFQR